MRRLPLPRFVIDFIERRPALTLVLAGLYLLSPFDVVPEFLVGPLGFVDDLLIVALATIPTILRERRRASAARRDMPRP